MVNVRYPQSSVQEKAKRLFLFLKEYSELRSKSVRDISAHEEVIWFADVPAAFPGCYCSVHVDEHGQSSRAVHDDTWLEIKKPRLTAPPTPPKDIEPWIDENRLDAPDLDEPGEALRKTTIVESADESQEGAAAVRVAALEDHPEVAKKWRAYIESKWKPWAAEERIRRRIQGLYQRLYSVYQRQKKLGEAYQVLLAVGLLTWRPSYEVRRHVVTLPASVTFEPLRGVITVSAAQLSGGPALELDMLDQQERPSLEMQEEIRGRLEGVEDLWSGAAIHDTLHTLINTLSSRGLYDESIEPQAGKLGDPILRFAPAIILRARQQRGFADFFQSVAASFRPEQEVSLGIRRLVEVVDDLRATDTDLVENGSENAECKTIFFPLPTNEQQSRIADALAHRQGVLVQGPPGTGKSHTIANLICHLLATGKRILVTSHTARALQVLHGKLSSDIAPLCVSILGSDQRALEDLQHAVQGITQRYENWDKYSNDRLIADLERKLDGFRRRKAEIEYEQTAIREREVFKHPVIFDTYQGSLSDIAEQIKNESDELSFLPGPIQEGQAPPLNDQEFALLIAALPKFVGVAASELLFKRPSSSSLPSPTELGTMIRAEMSARANRAESDAARKSRFFAALNGESKQSRDEIHARLTQLIAQFELIVRHRLEWTENVARDILANYDGKWRELLQGTKAATAELRKIGDDILAAMVSGVNLERLPSIIADVDALIAYLRAGKRIGKLAVFQTQVVKRTSYIWSNTSFNGRECNDIEQLEQLRLWLHANEHLFRLEQEWATLGDIPKGSVRQRLAQFEDMCQPLVDAAKLSELLHAVRTCITSVVDLPHPRWHEPDDLRELRRVLDAIRQIEVLLNIEGQFEDISEKLKRLARQPECHPLAHRLLASVENRDLQKYEAAFSELLAIEAKQVGYDLFRHRLNRLLGALPAMDQYLSADAADVWVSRATKFVAAWNHGRAKHWLDRLSDASHVAKLARELTHVEASIGKCLAELAAARAWSHCFGPDGMKEADRQNLVAWAKAVQRVGKGTGRHAARHRAVAKDRMAQCRSAIPAWIMPLYRVVESMRVGSDKFDVAIIDEASQSGPEALLLHALADKIVIVGDDKQISPENVGLDLEVVGRLREEFIPDLPQHEFFGPEYSYFGLAEILFGGRIRLREHFRCMPEIIEFSNGQYYRDQPLIPLRQYGLDRLPPVKTVYVRDGYRKGTGQRVVNLPEADAIAAQIAECIAKPAYVGKTMGVISLLGEAQAREVERRLLALVGPEEMERRELVCGDAYSFQGDERDIMFLSLVAAPNENNATLVRITDQQRFNVAVSRARDQLWLFHSISLTELSPQCERHKLLKYCLNPKVGQGPIDLDQVPTDIRVEPFDSLFEQRVFNDIGSRGYRVIPQYEMAGYKIDLLVEGMSGRLAIECDGDQWHGPEQYLADLARQRQLERCGLTFWRVGGSEYFRDPHGALEGLWRTLERRGIFPQGANSASAAAHLDSPYGNSLKGGDSANSAAAADEHSFNEGAEEQDFVTARRMQNRHVGNEEVETSPSRGRHATAPAAARIGAKHVQTVLTLDDDFPTSAGSRQDGDDQLREPKRETRNGAAQYRSWTAHVLPDPRRAELTKIVKGMFEIAEHEGPIVASRLYRLYSRAAGIDRTSREIRSLLNRALARALRSGALVEDSSIDAGSRTPMIRRIVRVPRSQEVVIRTRGDRTIDEIPVTELAAVMAQRLAATATNNKEDAFRFVMDAYGLQRMTANTREYLEAAWRVRNGEQNRPSS